MPLAWTREPHNDYVTEFGDTMRAWRHTDGTWLRAPAWVDPNANADVGEFHAAHTAAHTPAS